MLNQSQRRNVWVLIAVVFLVSAVMSEVLRPGHEEYIRVGGAPTGDTHIDAPSPVQDTTFQALLPKYLPGGVSALVEWGREHQAA